MGFGGKWLDFAGNAVDGSVADLQQCDLSEVGYPYIWLDATCIKSRDAGRVQSTVLVVADNTVVGGKVARHELE